jgi:hypothetical protein
VSGVAPMRYPLEPLLKLTGWTLRGRVREIAPYGSGEYRLRRDVGVTANVADRLAIAAGYHPCEIWPSWTSDCPLPVYECCKECEAEFLPTRPGHIYCHPNCSARARKRRAYHSDPEARARRLAQSAAYYEEAGEYVRAAVRRRYWADPETHRARVRDRAARKAAESITDKAADFNKSAASTGKTRTTPRSPITPHSTLASMAS